MPASTILGLTPQAWGNIGSGLLNVGGGALAGGLASKALGGDFKTGAIGGGGLGLLNFTSGGGFGEGFNFGDSLLGQGISYFTPAKKPATGTGRDFMGNVIQDKPLYNYQTTGLDAINYGVSSPQTTTPKASTGLFSDNFLDTAKGIGAIANPLAQGYGAYTQRQGAKEQLGLQKQAQAFNLAAAADAEERRRRTEQAAQTAFRGSGLYYS